MCIRDSWWTATRHEVGSYDTFKTAFKQKYWLEATQNIIRDDITNGKFDVNGRQSMTTYFLGKICLARNLEPAIPEECLVTKLAYHFNQGISQGRLNSQIKTIQGMCYLLESHEREKDIINETDKYPAKHMICCLLYTSSLN